MFTSQDDYDVLTLDNIDLEVSGLYNKRAKISSFVDGTMANAVSAEQNEYLRFNEQTGHYDFNYSAEIPLSQFPLVSEPNWTGWISLSVDNCT